MATQVDVIKSLVQSLISAGKAGTTGSDALTSFLNTYGLSNYAALKTKFVDAMSGYSSSQTFLENVCGIRVNNTDTGAITGSDAGGSTTKTADSIIPESTAAVELTEAEYNSFTKDGLTVNVTYSDSIYDDASYNAGQKFNNDIDVLLAKQRLVVRALYNWWIPEAVKLIKESLGIDFSSTLNLSTINIKFSNSSSTGALTVNTNSDMGLASTATFTINMYKLASITTDDLNGIISNDESSYVYNYDYISLPQGDGVSGYNKSYYSGWTSYFDRIVLMGLTEVALRANIPYFYNLPDEVQDGLRKLVNGFDDGGLKSSANTSTGVAASTSDGYALLRFLARNYAGIEYNEDMTAMTVTADYVHASLPSSYVSINSNIVTITGASRTSPLNISGNESGNVIVGTSGADTINGKVGNDTITGGSGSDVFIYTSGEGFDVITDYTAGELISVEGGTVSKSSVSGSDVILTIGTGSVNIKNSVGKAININNSVTLIQGSANADNLTGTANSDSILGGAGNDVINGNAGDDTLNGEAGNDTLTGGAGADIFVYSNGAGNDVITDYSTGQDSIRLASGSISKSSLKGSDVVLTVGSGSITVKNAKGQQITVIDSKGNSTSKVYGSSTTTTSSGGTSTTLTVNNSTKSPVTVGSAIKTINASTRTTAVKIAGNSLSNSIIGGSGADSLSGGAGIDTLNGGRGNDTLTGGAGNDVFIYRSGQGNDVITDYATGDKIKITGAKISSTSLSGSDVVLKVGTGSIKVKNGKGKKLSLYNNATSLTSTVIGSGSSSTSSGGTSTTKSTTLTVTNSTKSPVTAASTIKTINAASRTTAVKITGNSLANSIVGGSGADSILGNAGADTLNGGRGNDTLTGGAGNDVFIYRSGQGNDVITDYTAQDKISITGGTYTKSTVGNDIKLKVGTGSILLKNAKNKNLNITTSSTSKSFVEIDSPWFAVGDNFTTSELDSIIDDKSDNIAIDYKLNDESTFNQSNQVAAITYNQRKK